MFEIKTLRDLTHTILNIPDVENSFGSVVSPEVVILGADGKELEIKDMYLRGDDKVLIQLKERKVAK